MPTLMLYPALDILDGRCARPNQDDSGQVRVYDEDPIAVARHWRDQGAEWLHVVDLDGALAGAPKHLDLVRAIVDATNLSVQFGGGLRTERDVEAALDTGAARVVLGATAARDTELLAGCLARWRDRVAVSVDAHGGQVTVAGWLEVLSEPARSFAMRMAEVGVQTLVITSIERGGNSAEASTIGLDDLRAALPETRLLVAGSFTSLDDIRWLAAAGVDGAVLGRALYEGTLDLAAALRILREPPQESPPPAERPREPEAQTDVETPSAREAQTETGTPPETNARPQAAAPQEERESQPGTEAQPEVEVKEPERELEARPEAEAPPHE